MQKWEYLSIVAIQSPKDNEFRPKYVNNQEIKNWEKGSLLTDYMNEMGDKGWELVSEQRDSLMWQYRRVWAESNWGKFTTQDGKKYEGLDGYVQYMNDEMGLDGWELATTAVQTSSSGFPGPWLLLFKKNLIIVIRLRFKRPKS